MKKILLIGAGRRVEFSRLLQEYGFDVHSIESSFDVPITEAIGVDHVHVMQDDFRISSKDGEQLDKINTIVKRLDGVSCILPLIDSASQLLKKTIAPYYKHMNLHQVVYMSKQLQVCYDKGRFQEHMLNYLPDLYPIPSMYEPMIKKPVYGNSSRGVEEVEFFGGWNTRSEFVYQKKIDGTEYSIDCMFDGLGDPLVVVPRTRDRVAGGEVVDSTVISEYSGKLDSIARKMGRAFKFYGPVNIQVIVDQSDTPYVIEANERFGGGCTLSMHASGIFKECLKVFTWADGWRTQASFNASHDVKWGMSMKRHMESTYYE